MNRSFTRCITFSFIVLTGILPLSSFAQGTVEYSPEKIDQYKENVRNLVSFLEFSFNTLGNPQTTARDKDVIINQSYAKIFANSDVQVEDDLDDARETLINKDVQAYLKDIDFFFKEAVFGLNISSIDHYFNDDKNIYFIVTLTRTLNATTIDGKVVSSNKERFIEVNYDDLAQDLRIVSIYTTRIDEKDELFAWWNSMSQAWRDIIGTEVFISDSTPLSKVVEINDTMAIAEYMGLKELLIDTILVYGNDTLKINETEIAEGLIRDTILLKSNYTYRLLQRIASEKEIDVSGNLYIRSLEPLSRMGEVTKVNCSNTMIDDLSPLRNLINIESLDCSGTSVTSLSPLQYSISLTNLDFSYTLVRDISPVANLRRLEKLTFAATRIDSLDKLSDLINLRDLRFDKTKVSDINPVSRMQELRIINFSGTYVSDIEPLKGLLKLERLYLSNTPVNNIEALSGLDKLQTVYLDSTNISTLQPISGLLNLESVYCDNTGITGIKASKFMAENPKVLVVHESTTLAKWWESMDNEWQQVFRKISDLKPIPTKEQLHKLSNITQIDVSGNSSIKTLAPLKEITHLSALDCSNTGISDLSPIADLVDMQWLNCSNNGISNCESIRDLINLEYLDISNTQIKDIQCISRIKRLRDLDISNTAVAKLNVFGENKLDLILADKSGVNLEEVKAFKKVNPDCIIVYQTEQLQAWWEGLNAGWKEIFTSATNIKNTPDATGLQRIADLTEIDLGQRKSLQTLSPLQKLYRLQKLKMNDTQIPDLTPISNIRSLQVLIFSDNPVQEIAPISGLLELKHLEFENTPVSDLEPITGLINLEILNMAGTQIKKLNELETLGKLRQLSFYNTSVKSLSPIEGLKNLEIVKCYNTRLNGKKVNKFGEERPGCEIIFY
ncbi:MAG TPA: leucine-rich repeat domain-containing protein [Bacteroidales bacterium]|nr:leucine-rich repeat domain-containing protein [Bacteroidales bacterium]